MEHLRALIVDDSLAMRRSILFALQRMGVFTLDEAQDGVEGLKKFNETRFDLVLTDINMPVMDGLKLIGHIRSENPQVPIVVISTESAGEDVKRALDLGASAYLMKPVQAREIVETVRKLLQLDS